MSPTPQSTTPDVLRGLLVELLEAGREDELIDVVVSLFSRMKREQEYLANRLRALRRGRSGGESEKASSEQVQMLLLEAARSLESPASTEDSEDAEDAEAPDERRKKNEKRKSGRPASEDRIVRVEIPVAVPDGERACPQCGTARVCIGHESTRMLEYVPGHFEERTYQLEKLACEACHGEVVQAPSPLRPIPGGLPGFGLATDVVVRKYLEQCPVNRLHEAYQRLGATLALSTMYDWCGSIADRLAPVAQAIHEEAFRAYVMMVDDTGVTVLDPEAKGGRVHGHMWAFLGDNEWLAFHYTPDWTADEPCTLLFERTGWLQADAYAGYDRLYKGDDAKAVEVGCWAHARRYFVKALDRGDLRASHQIKLIGKLFKIEDDAKDAALSHEARLARRQAESRPIVERLRKLADDIVAKAPPQSPLGKALTYFANQWTPLTRFLDDGRLPLTTNDVERALRHVAVGRKNWMHCGSHEGARRAGILYTVLLTARLQGVDPAAYLRGLLRELARREWSQAAIRRELLPRSRDWAADEQAAQQAGADQVVVH